MTNTEHPVPASMHEAIQQTAAARGPAREALATAQLAVDNLHARLRVVRVRLDQAKLSNAAKVAELRAAGDLAIETGDDAAGLNKLDKAEQLEAGAAEDRRLEAALSRRLDEATTALRRCEGAVKQACERHRQAVENAQQVYVSKMPLYDRDWPAFVQKFPRPAAIADATWPHIGAG